jgi:hypothetical protein
MTCLESGASDELFHRPESSRLLNIPNPSLRSLDTKYVDRSSKIITVDGLHGTLRVRIYLLYTSLLSLSRLSSSLFLSSPRSLS